MVARCARHRGDIGFVGLRSWLYRNGDFRCGQNVVTAAVPASLYAQSGIFMVHVVAH
ncbi:MAG: hypothetical protein OJF55_001897 [Rhodanobacteraceae bacterium]|jgi:hypothetical protein|nr:MAG: hypothetical protein OJF55_001897 [Rhodanobacteraceae bacterium]